MKIKPTIKTIATSNLIIFFLISCSSLSQSPSQKPQIPPEQPEPTSPEQVEQPSENLSSGESPIHIYMIALEDNGKSGLKVGCGDSLIEVETQAGNAEAALALLLDNHNQWYGQSGLYNALYQSNLKVVRLESNSSNLQVDLSGNLLLGGVCDNPRVNDQLKATIRQSTADNLAVIIRINGVLLDDLLSQK